MSDKSFTIIHIFKRIEPGKPAKKTLQLSFNCKG